MKIRKCFSLCESSNKKKIERKKERVAMAQMFCKIDQIYKYLANFTTNHTLG